MTATVDGGPLGVVRLTPTKPRTLSIRFLVLIVLPLCGWPDGSTTLPRNLKPSHLIKIFGLFRIVKPFCDHPWQ